MNPVVIGNIPITSVTNPSKVSSKLYGDGTAHPIGINFRDMMKYLWNVKSFNSFITTSNQTDAFEAFLAGGGSIGDINASLVGISAAQQALSGAEFGIVGATQIVNKNLSPVINPLQIFGVCGRIHYLAGNESVLLIDFTEILLKQDKYWPKIIINLGPNSSLVGDVTASSSTIFDTNIITFDGYPITMYAADLSTFIFGEVNPLTYF